MSLHYFHPTIPFRRFQKHIYRYIRLANKGTHIGICRSLRKRDIKWVLVSCDWYEKNTGVDIKALLKDLKLES